MSLLASSQSHPLHYYQEIVSDDPQNKEKVTTATENCYSVYPYINFYICTYNCIKWPLSPKILVLVT